MNYFLLGAGKPFSGKNPAMLNSLNDHTRIIDWQINTAYSLRKNIKISLVIGYKSNLIQREIKKINIIVNKKWKSNSAIETFFSLPLTKQNTLISYADTIFDKDILNKILNIDGEVIVGIDRNWKNRYPNRSKEDIKVAEKIRYKGKLVEFTGLVYFRSEVIEIINKLKKKKKSK